MKSIFTLLLISSSMSSARLGETQEQCIQRYGQPLEAVRADGKLQIRKEGIDVFLWFREGKCVSVTYQFEGLSLLNQKERPSFTQAQVMKLLELNGAEWSQKEKASYGPAFCGIYQTVNGEVGAKINEGVVAVEFVNETLRQMENTKEAHVNSVIGSFVR